MMLTRAAFALCLIGAAALIGPGAWTLAGRIEARTSARALAALENRPWARVEIDGARIVLKGVAPDEAERFRAIRALAALGGVTRIDDRVTVAERPPAAPRAAPRVVALKDLDSITLSGLAPASAGGARDLSPWRESLPEGTRLTDAALAEAADGGPSWRAARRFAAAALGSLDRAHAVISPGRVRIVAAAPSPEEAAALERRLRDAAPAGVSLELSIDAPRPVFAPFRVAAARDADGAALSACNAQSIEEARSIVAALPRPLAPGQPAPRCAIGLGAPSARWGEAAVAGLTALAALPAGRFELRDAEARLTGLAPTDPAAFDAAARRLKAELGAGFSLVVEPPPAAPDAAPAAPAAAADRIWSAARRDADGVVVTGAAPDDAARRAVSSYAKALFGAAAVGEELTVADAPAPAGWRRATIAALDALAALDSGAASYDGRRISVSGRLRDPEALHDLRAALSEAPGGLAATSSTVVVDLPAIARRLPLSPTDCSDRLNAIVDETPIVFAPASAEIDATSAPTLDRLARTLTRCADAIVEIEGHTDSQGGEEGNLELSRRRADAVLEALLARGVGLARLRATGYGESRPIAANNSEAGRARNRRIAFAVRGAQPSPPEGDDPK